MRFLLKKKYIQDKLSHASLDATKLDANESEPFLAIMLILVIVSASPFIFNMQLQRF